VSCGATSFDEAVKRCSALWVRLRAAIPGNETRDLFELLIVSRDPVVMMDIFLSADVVDSIGSGK
jgi:hypothetical protein